MMCMAQPPPPPPLLPPAPVYNHLPAHLAQQLAALPPLPPHGRGRGRDRGRAPSANINNNPFMAPLPPHLVHQLAALPSLGRGHGVASIPPAPLDFILDLPPANMAVPPVPLAHAVSI
jgi:hypothetical protein